MNIFPRPLVFFCIIILNGCMVFCLWMCIIYVTVFYAKILDSLFCFTLRSLTTANFLVAVFMHMHGSLGSIPRRGLVGLK